MLPEVTVSSWNQLNDEIFAGSLNSTLRRFRSNYAFRGVADKAWDLRTSLMRLEGNYGRLENPVLRSFRKYAHRDSAAGDSVWNHSCPKRLRAT